LLSKLKFLQTIPIIAQEAEIYSQNVKLEEYHPYYPDKEGIFDGSVQIIHPFGSDAVFISYFLALFQKVYSGMFAGFPVEVIHSVPINRHNFKIKI